MQDLSLHILDIAENSIRAGAKAVEIRIKEDLKRDYLEIEIQDDGYGMEPSLLEKAIDPFFTTKSVRKVGLGLSLFKEAARIAGGDLVLHSEPGQGTKVKATFQHSHIDRKPLGDMAKTLITLIIGNREVHFQYFHRKDGRECWVDSTQFNNQSIGKKQIRLIRQGLQSIQPG